MNINNYFLFSDLPKLDLHGSDKQTAVYLINQYIKDNIKLRNELITIVHGKGAGILFNATNQTLKNHPDVLEYKCDYYNPGCTVVHLKI